MNERFVPGNRTGKRIRAICRLFYTPVNGIIPWVTSQRIQRLKFNINGVILDTMKHRKPEFRIDTFGEYRTWDQKSKEIPKIKEITSEIVAFTGLEFGYVLHIRKGKGEKLTYKITHPPFRNRDGSMVSPFTGEHYIAANDYKFFLGDCVTDPVEDKRGEWEFTTFHHGKIVAHKKLVLV